MRASSGKLVVTKIAAAQRQLDAAIRLELRGEDALAIHTLASAAFRILRDLRTQRGQSDIRDIFATGLFHLAHDFAAGKKLPESMRTPEIDNLLKDIAEKITISNNLAG